MPRLKPVATQFGSENANHCAMLFSLRPFIGKIMKKKAHPMASKAWC